MQESDLTKQHNESMFDRFSDSLDNDNTISEVTKRDYRAKLRKMMTQIQFDDSEYNLIEYLSTIENPNSRSANAFALIRLRRFLELPTVGLFAYRNDIKSEIVHHRKMNAKENLHRLMTYETLVKKLDELHGVPYLVNHLFIFQGLRNRDINVRVYSKVPKNIEGNILVHNPALKRPKATLYITNYKTAKRYGDKEIVIKDRRFLDELESLDLDEGEPLLKTRNGEMVTDEYLGVVTQRLTIGNYGEGRIVKICVAHYIDTKQFDKVNQIAEQRGTSLGQIYTSYNVFDCK